MRDCGKMDKNMELEGTLIAKWNTRVSGITVNHTENAH
jgi:hypothetical protein